MQRTDALESARQHNARCSTDQTNSATARHASRLLLTISTLIGGVLSLIMGIVRGLGLVALAGCLSLLVAGCGSNSAPSPALRLTANSTCAQWQGAGHSAQQAYVAQVLHEPTEGHGHYELGHAQAYLVGWLAAGCQKAALTGHAAISTIGSIASAGQAKAAARGEAVSPTTATTTKTAAPTTTVSAQPAPNKPPAAPPFWLEGSTTNGDRLRLDAHFGPIQSPSESDVNQETLSGCQQADGRELLAELVFTATIESKLSAQVIVGGFIPQGQDVSRLVDLLLDYDTGPVCETLTEESKAAFNLGTLQPHQPATFIMWVVLPDAITPNNPQPSYQALAKDNWVIGGPEASVDGSAVDFTSGGNGKGLAVIK
jgi:hypothetical protein